MCSSTMVFVNKRCLAGAIISGYMVETVITAEVLDDGFFWDYSRQRGE